jgi:hypothetical protein
MVTLNPTNLPLLPSLMHMTLDERCMPQDLSKIYILASSLFDTMHIVVDARPSSLNPSPSSTSVKWEVFGVVEDQSLTVLNALNVSRLQPEGP